MQALNNAINFQKTLKANCKVINCNTQKPANCKIWELDKAEDGDYFEKLEEDENWQNSIFLICQVADFKIPFIPSEHYYVIEDENERCLGYALTEDKADECKLMYIEVVTSFKNDFLGGREKEYKYIGETLLSFITKKAQKQGAEKIKLNSIPTAVDFYQSNCGFEVTGISSKYPFIETEMVLNGSKFNELIKHNEQHTTGKIDMVC